MSRPLRLELSGGLYHVTSRGDRREAIFVDDEDRLIWLEVLAHCCARFNWAIHAWCLMDNHYHLVIAEHRGQVLLYSTYPATLSDLAWKGVLTWRMGCHRVVRSGGVL